MISLSTLGAIHTIISIAAIIYAFIAFAKYGKIIPGTPAGNYYTILTIFACLTAFGLSKAGGFNPGHGLAIMILVFLGISWWLKVVKKSWAGYVQTFLMTTTLLLSLIPAVNETLTRVPLGHPLATDITSPAITNTLMGLLVIYFLGVIAQLWYIKRQKV